MACNCAWNFAAGPARLPDAVLERARDEVFARGIDGAGHSERPFSSPASRALREHAAWRLRELLALPPVYRILFLAGGAMQQFALLPLNLGQPGRVGGYVDTGYWSRRARLEGSYTGATRMLALRPTAAPTAASAPELPALDSAVLDSPVLDSPVLDLPVLDLPPDSAAELSYVHLTSNETADGLAWPAWPEAGDIPLVTDATSDFLSAPCEVGRFGLIYASAQKNIGPAGLTVALIREDLLERSPDSLSPLFSYRRQAAADSCVNTPPLLALHLATLVFDWIAAEGGLAEMARRRQRRAERVYAAIDRGSGFYHAPAPTAWRSPVTICFQLPGTALTERFLAEAEAAGLYHLRGHPQVGGIRASLYNAMPEAGAQALAEFMDDFRRRCG